MMRISSAQWMALILLGGFLAWGTPAPGAEPPAALREADRAALSRTAVPLARSAIENCLQRRPQPTDLQLPQVLRRCRAGAFVTVMVAGKTRACMGTVSPTAPNLGQEIIAAAVMAAGGDPWHRPLQAAELKRARIEVTICGATTPIPHWRHYSPARDGLLVRMGHRTGVVLPGEARTARWAYREACRKASVRPGQQPELFRFEALRLVEPRH